MKKEEKFGEVEIVEILAKAKSSEVGECFNNFITGVVRQVIMQTMQSEVGALCGEAYDRESAANYERGGSAPGWVYIGNKREKVNRPRVRRRTEQGVYKEEKLHSYEAAKDGSEVKRQILAAMVEGVSCRGHERMTGKGNGASKSQISRQWKEKGLEYIDELRSRPLGEHPLAVLMLDGVYLSEGITAVVALGIKTDGTKMMLDFEVGSSENTSVCNALTARLAKRGCRPAGKRFLAVLDGSEALRNGVRSQWPEALIQTCLVHVSRNIRHRMSKKYHGEIERLFNKLRVSCNLETAIERLNEIEEFVAKHSSEGAKTLKNARDEMLTLFRLNVPDSLNKSLLSTNCIENGINNIRRCTKNAKRWRSDTNMVERWIAFAQLEVEKGFNRIQGYLYLNNLIEALNRAAPLGGQGNELAGGNKAQIA